MAIQQLQPQLERVLAVVHDVLGEVVLGAYLHGSAVLGQLRPRSDLDVFVVAARATTHEEKRRLVDGLALISDRDDDASFARPVELTIVVGPEIRPWRYPPPIDFLYGEWLRDRYHRDELEPEAPTSPDLATVISIVLLGSHSLVGPPPAELLDPVPPADLRRAMTDELPSLLAELDTDTRNIVLTLARIWTTVATGEILSKDAAADWAITRLPPEHRPVLARARAIYLGEVDERWEELRDRLHPFARHVVGEIEGARRG
jgi:streptomycin 3"-adenylyltransferase